MQHGLQEAGKRYREGSALDWDGALEEQYSAKTFSYIISQLFPAPILWPTRGIYEPFT